MISLQQIKLSLLKIVNCRHHIVLWVDSGLSSIYYEHSQLELRCVV